MIKNTKTKKATIEAIARHQMKKAFFLVNAISDQHGLRRLWLKELSKLELTITFSTKAKCSLGGYNYKTDSPILKFSFHQFLATCDDKRLEFHEYKMFHKREDIGSCQGDLNTVISALCAHEVGHVFQFFLVKMRKRLKIPNDQLYFGFSMKDTEDGHGDLWRSVYSQLRVGWVNKLPSYRLYEEGS